MFDPARDDDPGSEPFYRRLFAIVMIAVVASIALWPSVSGFEVGPDASHACVAIRDAFRDAPAAPSVDEPDCGPPARHRIIVTGLGFAILGLAVGTGVVMRGRRRASNLRQIGREYVPRLTQVRRSAGD